MPYTVSTPVFEGPFDLLLHLISREQVELWEVSIADIVDGYVSSLAEIGAVLDLESATEFLLIASVLLELKTRRLLPGRAEVEPDEELSLWEERDLLVARLLECKTFKDASLEFARMMDGAALSWPRRVGPGERYRDLGDDVMSGVTAERLRDVMRKVLEQVHYPRATAGLRYRCSWNHERVAVRRIESLSQVPCQLQVLALVVPDGNTLGVISEDVRGHQARVGEQPHA